MTEKVKRIYWMWGTRWYWWPDWSRQWRDYLTGYRFRVIKWGPWVVSIRRDRRRVK